jgi:uncharacterized phage-associated protein
VRNLFFEYTKIKGDDIMYTVFDVANWFLANVEDMTHKKLQKLVYYAYAWYIAFNNEDADNIENKFFDNRVEAWIHGPVFPDLYRKYKYYGSNILPRYDGVVADFSEDDLDLLEQVRDIYGIYNGNQLESLTHQEEPWMAARNGAKKFESCNCKISDEIIFDCYSSRLVEG